MLNRFPRRPEGMVEEVPETLAEHVRANVQPVRVGRSLEKMERFLARIGKERSSGLGRATSGRADGLEVFHRSAK